MKLSMVVLVWDLRTCEAEAGGSGAQGQPLLRREFEARHSLHETLSRGEKYMNL